MLLPLLMKKLKDHGQMLLSSQKIRKKSEFNSKIDFINKIRNLLKYARGLHVGFMVVTSYFDCALYGIMEYLTMYSVMIWF